MFCSTCGKHIPDQSTFCMYCGSAVLGSRARRPCPDCGDEQEMARLKNRAAPPQGTLYCYICSGTGKTWSSMTGSCSQCGGRGYYTCPRCSGQGYVSS